MAHRTQAQTSVTQTQAGTGDSENDSQIEYSAQDREARSLDFSLLILSSWGGGPRLAT